MKRNARGGGKTLVWPQLKRAEAEGARELAHLCGFSLTDCHCRQSEWRARLTLYREVKRL
jgi:hypothetical protein